MVRCAAVCLCCTILDRRPQGWTFYEGMQRSTAWRSKGLVKGAKDCNWNRLPLRPGPPEGAKDCLRERRTASRSEGWSNDAWSDSEGLVEVSIGLVKVHIWSKLPSLDCLLTSPLPLQAALRFFDKSWPPYSLVQCILTTLKVGT